MKSSFIGQIDKNTGEELEGVLVFHPTKSVNGFSEFFTMNQEQLLYIINDANGKLSGNDLRVFLALCAHLDFDNYISVTQAKIAEEVGMKRPNVTKSISALVEKGVLERGPKVGRTFTYRLDLNVGWRGKGVKHKKELNSILKKKMKEKGISVVNNNQPQG